MTSLPSLPIGEIWDGVTSEYSFDGVHSDLLPRPMGVSVGSALLYLRTI